MPTPSNLQKWEISIFSGLLFLLIANPITFRLVNSLTKLIGFQICNAAGCPNTAGIILHTVVFILLVRLSMFIKF